MHHNDELDLFRTEAIRKGLLAVGSHVDTGVKRFIFGFNHADYYVPNPTPKRVEQFIILAGNVRHPALQRMLLDCTAEIGRLGAEGYALWMPCGPRLLPGYVKLEDWLRQHHALPAELAPVL
jgi:hypothetical protein